jgi:hypothetical protein
MLNTPKKIRHESATEWCGLHGSRRLPRCTGVLAAVAIFWFVPATARADLFESVNLSNVTFVGKNVCGPSGTQACTETITGSLVFDATTGFPNFGSPANVSGPLLSPFVVGGLEAIYVPCCTFAPSWTNNSGDLIGFIVSTTTDPRPSLSVFIPPGNYPVSDVALVCGSGVCTADFGVSGVFAPLSASSGTVSVTVVPEPPSLALVTSGILGLALTLHKTRRRFGSAPEQYT